MLYRGAHENRIIYACGRLLPLGLKEHRSFSEESFSEHFWMLKGGSMNQESPSLKEGERQKCSFSGESTNGKLGFKTIVKPSNVPAVDFI